MNNLKIIRKKADLTLEQLGELVGANKSQIHRLEIGKTKLHSLWLEKLARALNVTQGEILGDHLPVTSVLVRGYVQAGNWSEANELPEDDWTEVYAPQMDKYPKAYGLMVRGDSMDQHFKEGDTLICAPIYEMTSKVKSGDFVICKAVCAEGLHETTVKQFHIDSDGNKWLIPKSDNPIYQAIRMPNGETQELIINGRNIVNVEIIAVVVGSFNWTI